MTDLKRTQNRTLPAGSWFGRATIPAVRGLPENQPGSGESSLFFQPGDRVGAYSLTKQLCRGTQSTLYLAENRRQERVVIKIYEPGTARTTPCLRKLADILRRTGCPSLMPLLSFGDLENNTHYEVMPVYQQGTLVEERFTEDELIRYILPQLNNALRTLGDNHLVHNDIKPSNIVWKNREKKEIVLGDYDSITFDRKERAGGTPLYMAPERIFTQGTMHTSASDYCSLGLTLVTFLSGRPLLEEEGYPVTGDGEVQKQYLYRRWQKQVACPVSLQVSPRTRDLLDRLLQQRPEDRYNGEFINSWIENDGLGFIAYREKREKKSIRGLRYRDHLILDIPELLKHLGDDWEFGTFMLKQHRLDDFVRQFDGEFYRYSLEYSSIHDSSAGLFMLMQSISPTRDFYWRGTHYDSLESFVDETEAQESYGIGDPFCHFMRAGLLSFYEKTIGAEKEQIQRAIEIETTGKHQPELAVRKLQISLRQKPDFVFRGATFASLEDILDFLEKNKDKLDEYVTELYESKAAKVWLDYIGQGSLLPEIEKSMLTAEG